MQFNGRGFYNTLVFSATLTHAKWQVEDYSALSIEKLFLKLSDLGIKIDESIFKNYVENADSPEELAEILTSDEAQDEAYEKAYLVVFELWKRLFPKKETLSIFLDRLDHLINDYDLGKPVSEDLVKALFELQKILENLATSGLSYKETYETIASYLASDLEVFLYDFLSDLLEAGENTLTFELLFGFYDFIHDKLGLDLLKSTLNLLENPEETESVFLNVIEKVFEHKRHALILDAIYFTYDNGFSAISRKMALDLLAKTHGDEKIEVMSLLEPLKADLNLKG